MRLHLLSVPAFIAGTLFCLTLSGRSETVILRQDFDALKLEDTPILGSPGDLGGSWKDFGKSESSPKLESKEFFHVPGKASGQSVKITRDDLMTASTDFWLTGTWTDPLDSGKIRASFRVFRDTADSGFSVHFGNAEKYLGVNTVAVAIGNRSTSLEKIQVMDAEGAWKTTNVQIGTAEWTQVVLNIDFSSSTYTVSIDGEMVDEAIPFVANAPFRQISFLPTTPDKNESLIDDVEVVQVD